MEYKKQGSDSESTLQTANNNVHQRIEYVRPLEEELDSVLSQSRSIPVNPHVENNFAASAGSPRQDLDGDSDHKAKPPRRPMTSYNIFFLLERERIISGDEEKTYTAEDAQNMGPAKVERCPLQTEAPQVTRNDNLQRFINTSCCSLEKIEYGVKENLS
jgi:hypothetical protein